MKTLEKVLLTLLYSFFFYLILGSETDKISESAILGTFYNALQEIYNELKKRNNETNK